MISSRLLRFGVTGALRASCVSSRSITGKCAIPPYNPTPPPIPPPPVFEIPSHLIRPPCLPGSEPSRLSPDCDRGVRGLYCPPQRLKYVYPPFSENIDFVPSAGKQCWWDRPPACDLGDPEDQDLPIKMP